ncbi:MAG: hypothetical protein K0R84_99 [Clostridia bacterium]|jgi:hypothetical protein|nr:hypothetical protein [Clostridia bacterium]
MFSQLTLKEVKYQLSNVTFYLLIAVVLLFYVTQYLPYVQNGVLPEPKSTDGYYGERDVTDPEAEIKVIYANIRMYYNFGIIYKQGLLVNKTVILSPEQKEAMKSAMDKLGEFKPKEEGIEDSREEMTAGMDRAMIPKLKLDNPLETVEVKVSYEEYLQIVRDLDKALGGSTYYSDKYRKYILHQPMTYEEAVKEFEEIVAVDRVTNAYGRVFADYMGIAAGLFPVFLSAFVLIRDRRSRMQELIYSRSISSIKYISSKYLGILICLTALYLAIAGHATFATAIAARNAGYAVDLLAFFKYTAAWIVPTLMFSTSMGMLVSLLFGNGGIAILVQFVLWLLSINSLGGSYELYRNVVRFNTLGAYDKYMAWLPQIMVNRIFYVILSILIVMSASWVLSLKRGSINGSKTFKADMVQYKDIA